MNHQKIRPGRWLYVVSTVMLLIALGIMARAQFDLSSEIVKADEELQRCIAPGMQTLLLVPGEYTIYHEYESKYGGQHFSNLPELKNLSCTLTSTTTAQPVELSPMEQDTGDVKLSIHWEYTIASRFPPIYRKGKSAWQFEIKEPGKYLLSATYPDTSKGPDVVLAVGRGVMGNIVKTMADFAIGSILSLCLGGLALITGIVTFIMRKMSKSRSGRISQQQNRNCFNEPRDAP